MPNWFRDNWPAPVRTIDDVWGPPKVEDTEWMRRCQVEGWVAVCKDGRIRRRRGERELMSSGALRVFCLANGQLSRDDQVERFRINRERMIAVANDRGPWMYGVYADKIEQLTLYK